jgi:ATP-dependent Clp protease ATP-binding subunit ClpA
MFERFTDRARRVLVLAQEEARDLEHAFIGTEHILLGLIREDDGVAAKALGALQVQYEVVREKVEEAIGDNTNPSPGSPPFTPRAKKVLELSLREALQLGHSYIGPEHLLLGLVAEGNGVAAQVLRDLGADMARVRTQVIQMMSGRPGEEPRVGERTPQDLFPPARSTGRAPESFAPPATSIVDAVRRIGERLRPDLDATTLDERALQIASELFGLLRQRWMESDDSKDTET